MEMTDGSRSLFWHPAQVGKIIGGWFDENKQLVFVNYSVLVIGDREAGDLRSGTWAEPAACARSQAENKSAANASDRKPSTGVQMCSTRTTTTTTTTSSTLTTTTTGTIAARAASPAQESPTVRRSSRSQTSAEKAPEPASESQSQHRPTAPPAYVSRAAEGSADADLLKILNATGVELEREDECDDTPLRRAARRGEVDVVRILLGSGAKIDAAHETIIYGEYGEVCDNFFGPTALVLAVENGHVEVVRLLIERGANLESAESCGRTALREAADRGHVDVLRILLSHGANIEAVAGGETPLRSAARRGADATAATQKSA